MFMLLPSVCCSEHLPMSGRHRAFLEMSNLVVTFINYLYDTLGIFLLISLHSTVFDSWITVHWQGVNINIV